MKLQLLTEDISVIPRIRSAIKGVKADDQAVIWYNPQEAAAFVSVGDWADPTPWIEAVATVVGKDNIECESESGPSGPGWVLVRDYHRIKDNFGTMTPQRRLELGLDDEPVSEMVSEGVVAAARGDILTTINDIAGKVARSAQAIFGDRSLVGAIGFHKPQVEYTDSEDDPAVVMLRLGGRTPETVAVTIYGDGVGETKLEMSERLSRLLGVPRHCIVSSLREVDAKLGEIVAVIKQKLGRRPSNGQGHDRAQVGGSR